VRPRWFGEGGDTEGTQPVTPSTSFVPKKHNGVLKARTFFSSLCPYTEAIPFESKLFLNWF